MTINVYVKSSSGSTPLLIYDKNEEVVIDEAIGASFSGSVFNLSCTIIGAGIMSLPHTLKVLGLVPGIVLIILAALLIEASVEMLLRFSKPGGCISYGDVMGDAFGMMGKMVLQVVVVVNNIGVIIVYLIIIEDVLSGSTSGGVHHPGVLEGWFGEHWWTGRACVLIVLTVVVFAPSICYKRIDSLRYTSALSVALAAVFLVLLSVLTAYKSVQRTVDVPSLFPTITDFASVWNFFTAVPVVVCAYVCHYNVHTIENELDEAPRMQAVVRSSLALCAIVYILTGLFGYLLFGESTLPDLLSNFDTDLGIPYGTLLNDIIRISYAGHIILIFPIVFHPLRLNLDGIFFSSSRSLASDNLRFALISAVLILIVLLGAVYIPDIWVVFQFVGATAGFFMAFIFPASIILRDPHGVATRQDKFLSISMIALAAFGNTMAIYSDIYSLLR